MNDKTVVRVKISNPSLWLGKTFSLMEVVPVVIYVRDPRKIPKLTSDSYKKNHHERVQEMKLVLVTSVNRTI